MRIKIKNYTVRLASFLLAGLLGDAVPAEAYTLFTAPTSYNAIWRGTAGGGTIDAAAGMWYSESGTELQAFYYGNLGAVTPARYINTTGINNILIGCSIPTSNTGLGLNGANLYILTDEVTRSWYPAATTAPGLTVRQFNIYDARTYITGGGSINQAAGTFTLNHGSLFVGDSGTGTYNIEGGVFQINNASSTAEGTGSKTYDIHVGSASSTPASGGTGTMNVAGTAVVVIPGTLYVGEKAAADGVTNTGTVNQTGGLVNASALNIHNGTYNFTGGSLQLTASPLAANTTYVNRTYNIAKDVTMTGGTLNLGTSSARTASGSFTGNLNLSGNAAFKLYGSNYQTTTFGGSNTVITLENTASFYANNLGIARNSGDKLTLNMSGGTFLVDGASALGDYGTFIINQSGGEFKAGGYVANEAGKVEMNLSGGKLTGKFASLATRGSVVMNVSGDYNWTNSNGQNIADAYVANTKFELNQTGASSVINVSSFSAASQTGSNSSATFNLSAGTFTSNNISVAASRPQFTGNINLRALTDAAGKFSTPTAGVTANIANISDYNVSVTAGTLNVSGTYKAGDHAVTLNVGSQTDAAGTVTSPAVTIGTLQNVSLAYSAGTTTITNLSLSSTNSVTGTGGTLNVGTTAVQNTLNAPITLSGTAVFNLTAASSNHAILNNIITIKENALCNLGYMFAAESASSVCTIHLEGGTLKTAGGALGQFGTFTINQTGGTYNPTNGYFGNDSGTAAMNLSHGKLEGYYEALGTRGNTVINVSGDYIWNDTAGTQVICYSAANNTSVVMTQSGTSSVTFNNILVGIQNNTGNFTYNLNGGTLRVKDWNKASALTNVTSKLNITDGTATIDSLSSVSLAMSGGKVTVGTLDVSEGTTLSFVYDADFDPLQITTALNGSGTLSVALANDFALDPNGIYTLVEAKNGAEIDLSGLDIVRYGDFYVDLLDGNIVLGGAAALPEPSTWVLLALALGMMGFRLRKKAAVR